MKKYFVLLVLVVGFLFTGCPGMPTGQKTYNGGDMKGFTVEKVSLSDRQKALERLKSLENKDNSIKGDTINHKSVSANVDIKYKNPAGSEVEWSGETLLFKFNGSVFYVGRVQESGVFNQWYITENGKNYEIINNSKHETNNSPLDMFNEVIECLEATISFEAINSDNYYLAYVYGERDASNVVKPETIEYSDTEKEDGNLVRKIETGFVSSYAKQFLLQNIEKGVVTGYETITFENWDGEVEIPEIPEIQEN